MRAQRVWFVLLGAAALAAGARRAGAQGPAITVGALVYAQYGYQLRSDSVTGAHLNNFDLTRAYINLVGRFPSGVYIRVTPDIFRNAAIGSTLSFRLKYAYVAYTPEGSPLTPKLGVLHTPWLDWEEALWDYRMQGTMAMERFPSPAGAGYLSSADLGAGVDGKFGEDVVNFQLGVYNGEFYSAPEGDEHKDVEGRVSVRVLETDDKSRVGGLRLTGYGAYGKPTGGGKRHRFIGMVSYKSKLLTLAGEFGRAVDRLDQGPPVAAGTPPVPETKGDIWSAFGVLNVPHTKAAVIARYDRQKPSTAAADNVQHRIIAGVSYQVSPQLRLLGDVDNLWLESGAYTNAVNRTRSTALLQAQLAF